MNELVSRGGGGRRLPGSRSLVRAVASSGPRLLRRWIHLIYADYPVGWAARQEFGFVGSWRILWERPSGLSGERLGTSL